MAVAVGAAWSIGDSLVGCGMRANEVISGKEGGAKLWEDILERTAKVFVFSSGYVL